MMDHNPWQWHGRPPVSLSSGDTVIQLWKIVYWSGMTNAIADTRLLPELLEIVHWDQGHPEHTGTELLHTPPPMYMYGKHPLWRVWSHILPEPYFRQRWPNYSTSWRPTSWGLHRLRYILQSTAIQAWGPGVVVSAHNRQTGFVIGGETG